MMSKQEERQAIKYRSQVMRLINQYHLLEIDLNQVARAEQAVEELHSNNDDMLSYEECWDILNYHIG